MNDECMYDLWLWKYLTLSVMGINQPFNYQIMCMKLKCEGIGLYLFHVPIEVH